MSPLGVFFALFAVVVAAADKERLADGGIVSRIQRHHGDSQRVDAEALVGSRKEADAVGQLPAEEAKKRLKAVAKRMDEDKDRKVTEAELTDWIVSSIRSVDAEETDERMREIDTDGDNKISWKEYVDDTFPHEHENELDGDDKRLLSEDKRYFEAADLDKDGMLSKEELSAFLAPENYDHMHAILVEVTMQEKDEDKDGAINLREYLGEVRVLDLEVADNAESEWHQAEKKRFSEEYDKDNNGRLTGEEVSAWLIPRPRDTAILEAKHLIGKADKDEDGSLSYDEIASQYELFVASEATKYGEHLDDIKHHEL